MSSFPLFVEEDLLTTHTLSCAAIVQDHLEGRATCVETITNLFSKMPDIQSRLNPFTQIFEDEAMGQARDLDRTLAQGQAPGPLHGVPITIKDMTPSAGHRTTRGSWTTGEGRTDHDAVVVKRLKQSGAIIIGKTTTAELAHSSFTSTRRYGATRNPWNPSRTSGGSSGGAAVSVATGLVPLAEGTDMGGSVRIPAAACGVVGFKPSLGRIPMDILPGTMETYSHFGPLARSVADAARFVAATAGADPSDAFSHRPAFNVAATAPADLPGRRFALSVDLGYCMVDPEVEAALRQVVGRLIEAGATVEEIELPWTRNVFDQWGVRWNCLMAMFPGTSTPQALAQMDPVLVRMIGEGRRTSASDLLAVDVLRKQMTTDLSGVFAKHDALLCPTTAIPAPSIEATDADFGASGADAKLQTFDMTHPFNMVPSCPALSLPAGLTGEGLPVAVQIVGMPFADETTLALGAAVEALIDPLPLPHLH